MMYRVLFKHIFMVLFHTFLQFLCIFSADLKEKKKYRNKEILIIGGTKGLGLSLALELSNYNNVTVTARRGLDATFLPIKYENMDITKALCIDEKYDAIFITAGYSQPMYFQYLTEKEIRDEFEVNYFGPLRVIRKIIESQQRYIEKSGSLQKKSVNMVKNTGSNDGSLKANRVSYKENKTDLNQKPNSHTSEHCVAPGIYLLNNPGTNLNGRKNNFLQEEQTSDFKEEKNEDAKEKLKEVNLNSYNDRVSIGKQGQTEEGSENIKKTDQKQHVDTNTNSDEIKPGALDKNWQTVDKINHDFQSSIIDKKRTPNKKQLKKRDIILIGSTLSFFPIPGFSAYSPTKTALYDFYRTTRHELKELHMDLYFYILSTTETPGYKQENISKPELTKKLENLTKEENVDIRAQTLLNSMKYLKTIPSDSTVWFFRFLPEIFIIEVRNVILYFFSHFYD